MAKKKKREKRKGKTPPKRKPAPDRLETALQNKRRVFSCVDGTQITLYKWNLRTAVRMGARLGGMLTTFIEVAGGVGDMLQMDVAKLLDERYEDFLGLVAACIVRDNFDSETEAAVWLEDEAELEDAIGILAQIAEMNVRPLASALTKLGGVVGKIVGQNVLAPSAPPPPTSSPA